MSLGIYHVTHIIKTESMPSEITPKIVKSLADRKNVEPDDLDIVLYDYIDLDALEKLSKHKNSAWRLEFELPNHRITVNGNGEIRVDGQIKEIYSSD